MILCAGLFSFGSIVTLAIMIAALVGMIVCAKKQRTQPNAQLVAVGLLAVVIICGVILLFKTGTLGDGEMRTLISNELHFSKVRGWAIGGHIGKAAPGSKILVLCGPDEERNPTIQAIIEGIKEGAGGNAAGVVVCPVMPAKLKEARDRVKAEMEKAAGADPSGDGSEASGVGSFEEYLEAADIDRAIASNNECKAVVSLFGLPRDADNLKIFEMDEKARPLLCLAGTGSLDMAACGKAIEAGVVSALAIYKPKWNFEAKPTFDNQKDFDIRNYLATKDTLEKIAQEAPNLFPSR